MTGAAGTKRAVIRLRSSLPRRPAGRSLAGVISAGVAVALALSGCGSGQAGASSAAGGAPSFGPVPAASAPASPGTGTLPEGVLASIPVDSALNTGFGFGSVWVASHRSNQLTRIDPATGKIVATIDTGMNACGAADIGFGRVWISGCEWDTTTIVVDPATNQVVGKIPYNGLAMGFGAGSAWIGTDSGGEGIYRINPETLAVQARIKANGFRVIFGYGSVWASDQTTATVARIDPATNKVIATIPAGVLGEDEGEMLLAAGGLLVYAMFENPMGAAEAGNRIWLINPHGDTVKEVTLAGFPPVYLPLTTGQIGAGMGSLWLRALGSPVKRYDARTLRFLGTYPADPHAEGFAQAGFGSLWVGNMDTCTLWRDRITG